MQMTLFNRWFFAVLILVLPPHAAAATNIYPGETKSGEVTFPDQGDAYCFSAKAGDTVTVLMGESPLSALVPRVELHAPDGTVVTSASDNLSATIEAQRLSQTGTYLIVCRDANGVNPGGYSVSLIKNPGPNTGDPEGGVILPGETKTGSISAADLDGYTFSANAGDTVTVLMGESPLSALVPRVELHAPDGTVVTSASENLSVTIEAQRLNQTGTYLIVCRDANGVNSGGYSVSLIKNPGLNAGDPEGGVILPGETKMGSISVADLDGYTFSANAGDTVTIVMKESPLTALVPQVELLGPDGLVVATASGNLSAAIQARRINQPGTYLIVCRDANGFNPGGYQLSFALSPNYNNQSLWVDVFGREQVRIGRSQSYALRCGNLSDTNIYDVLMLVRLPRNIEYSIKENRPILTGIDWNRIPQGYDDGSSIVVPVWIYEVPARSSETIVLDVKAPAGDWRGGEPFGIQAELKHRDSEFARTGNLASLESSPNFTEFRDSVKRSIEIQGGTIASAAAFDQSIKKALGDLVIDGGFATLETAITVGLWEAAAVGCISPWLAAGVTLYYTVSGAVELFQDFVEVYKSVIDAFLGGQAVGAIDPNAKAGPVGFGSQRFISGQESLPYTIFFENVPTATAPAQEVVVSEQLNSFNLDLATLELGAITFGDHQILPPDGQKSFATNVDLRPSTNLIVQIAANMDAASGILSWHFTSIDPDTGMMPDDPMMGFLPPNTAPPRGEGSVTYSVMTRQGLENGTLITNAATIIFDANTPIATPVWTNCLDHLKPASQVLPIASNQFGPFEVRWSGMDASAGVRDYTIYVSDNYGPFVPWLVNNTNTTAVFAPQNDHAYAFFSLARDGVGNVEDSPVSTAFTQVTALSLSINLAGNEVILSWPTMAPGFVLVASTNLNTNAIWSSVLPPPVVVSGQSVVTNRLTGPRMLYRLRSP
ncbi:MAG: hypothetical protein M1608_07015 [Candidatus Omnitrophica bacterium]|nr:hypothetical protein [Candidatus Omnitrophota bacterium]